MTRTPYRLLVLLPLWLACGVLVGIIGAALYGVAGLVVLMWGLT